MKYSEKIPLEQEYIKMIIDAIPNAYYLYKEYVNEQNFPTDNGKEGEIWNYINKCVIEVLPVERFDCVVLNRGRWKFLGIFDSDNNYLYTLMREKNLRNLQKKISEHLFHYVNALSKLNDSLSYKYEKQYHQITMFGINEYDDYGEEILDKILESLTKKFNAPIDRYTLITFDVDRLGNVSLIKGIIPAKGLDYYKEENWTSYVSSEYNIMEGANGEVDAGETAIILRRRPNIKRKNRNADKKENG